MAGNDLEFLRKQFYDTIKKLSKLEKTDEDNILEELNKEIPEVEEIIKEIFEKGKKK